MKGLETEDECVKINSGGCKVEPQIKEVEANEAQRTNEGGMCEDPS